MSSSSGKRAVELVRIQDKGITSTSLRHERQVTRDTKDVFPVTSKKQVVEVAKEKGLLDVKTFVSGSLVEGQSENQKDTLPIDARPLAEILMEQKERKQAEFEAGWKTMKVGKNRPLDEDEAAFLEDVVDHEIKKQTNIRKREEEQLDAFRKAQNNQGVTESIKTGNSKKRPAVSLDGVSKRPSKILQKRMIVKTDEAPKDEKRDDALNLLGLYGSDSE